MKPGRGGAPCRLSRFLTVPFLFLYITVPAFSADEDAPYERLTAVLHAHTRASAEVQPSAAALASLAGKSGVDVLLVTDLLFQRWEFGFAPFPGLVRVSLDRPGVFRDGLIRHLDHLRRAEEHGKQLIIVPAWEFAPAYALEGHPARGRLEVLQAHRHLVAWGLDRPEDAFTLPARSNPYAGPFRWRGLLFPALLTLAGLAAARRRPAGALLAAVGLLWFFNQRPFRRLPPAFENFSRNGYDAAQSSIDYIRSKGGVALWAHPIDPEQGTSRRLYRVARTRTDPYPEALLETEGHAAFGFTHQAEDPARAPGGTWDRALLAHAQGRRAAPVWAYAEPGCADHGAAGLRPWSARNVLWAKERSVQGFREAFLQGRFYGVIEGKGPLLRLDVWQARSGGQTALSGGAVRWAPGARLEAEVPAGARGKLDVALIRNGAVWRRAAAAAPWRASWPLPRPDGPDYYRLEVREKDGSFLAVNPIFVR